MNRIGDVYRVNTKKTSYFQFISRDLEQLNSDVICVYRNNPITHTSDTPLFYMHTTVLAGVKMGLWKKIGKAEVPDYSTVQFKQAEIDYLAEKVISEENCEEWRVWHINKNPKKVKKNLYYDTKVYSGWVYAPKVINYFIDNGAFPSEDFHTGS